jgi:hypothetical protein
LQVISLPELGLLPEGPANPLAEVNETKESFAQTALKVDWQFKGFGPQQSQDAFGKWT